MTEEHIRELLAITFEQYPEIYIEESLKLMAKAIHKDNEKWWVDINTGAPKERNVGEMLMLMVSELAEAMEGDRKNLPDTHLPHFPMLDVELADAVIRILDFAAVKAPNLGKATAEKLAYNRNRADHKIENRLKENGKKY